MNEGIPPEKTIQHFDLTFSKVRQGFCSSVISLLCLWLAVLAMDTQAMASDDIIAENAEGFFDISFGNLTEELGLLEEEGKKAILVINSPPRPKKANTGVALTRSVLSANVLDGSSFP